MWRGFFWFFFLVTFFLTIFFKSNNVNVYLQQFMYNNTYVWHVWCIWCMRTMNVDNENECIDVVCASINSAVSPRMEALSSVTVSSVKWMMTFSHVVSVLSVGVRMVVRVYVANNVHMNKGMFMVHFPYIFGALSLHLVHFPYSALSLLCQLQE